MKKDPTGSYIWGHHEETQSERKLAAALRKAGLPFAREVPVKGFTVDFLLDEWLVVEVDGESHLVSGRAEKDAKRQKAIEAAGFTVIRVPAAGLSAEHDLRKWVGAIKTKIAEGPPYQRGRSFENRDYKRQIAEIRKALEAGEEEKRKREALARDPSGSARRASKRGDLGSESMEDYFGEKARDFGSMLENYDWSKAPKKDDPRPGRPRKPR